jgi:uncharacterized OB-fold protein
VIPRIPSPRLRRRLHRKVGTTSEAGNRGRRVEGRSTSLRAHRDDGFFHEALSIGELCVQQYHDCAMVSNLPGPMCPHCWSLKWTAMKCSGAGTMFSCTTYDLPPVAGFETPHTIVLADEAEGGHLLGGILGIDPSGIWIGMAVRARCVRRERWPPSTCCCPGHGRGRLN